MSAAEEVDSPPGEPTGRWRFCAVHEGAPLAPSIRIESGGISRTRAVASLSMCSTTDVSPLPRSSAECTPVQSLPGVTRKSCDHRPSTWGFG